MWLCGFMVQVELWSVWVTPMGQCEEMYILLSVVSVVKTLSSSVCLVNVMSRVMVVHWNMLFRAEYTDSGLVGVNLPLSSPSGTIGGRGVFVQHGSIQPPKRKPLHLPLAQRLGWHTPISARAHLVYQTLCQQCL